MFPIVFIIYFFPQNVRGTSILGQGILTTAALTSTTVTTPSGKQGPPPMVAKVVTNAQGQQLITMEALQAQAKGNIANLSSFFVCFFVFFRKESLNQWISKYIFYFNVFSVTSGGTLRVAAAGGKAGQGNQLIQLAGSGAGGVPQFAVVSQGNIISLAGSLNTQRVVPQVCLIRMTCFLIRIVWNPCRSWLGLYT